MSKSKNITMYVCSNCGNESAKWEGKCSNCGEWNTYSTISVPKNEAKRSTHHADEPAIKKLSEVSSEEGRRISTSTSELDRVLGGGIIPGSVILVGGDPGIGKSTLMLQMAAKIQNARSLYISGEESLTQIKQRSSRLHGDYDDVELMAETNLQKIARVLNKSDYKVVIIDSIQSIFSEYVEATPGNAVQIRECASQLMQIAKEKNISIFIIGHVTKEGFIAGPKILEHMVDTVLQFEGEKTYSFRILRSLKNRFGSTNEIGIFRMGETGMEEIKNPSDIFIADRAENEPGIAIAAAIEGSRPIMIEIQALVATSSYGMPQRTVNGYDSRRVQMIIAVMEKRLGLNFSHSDVFINVAGGLYVNDTSVDLAVAIAMISSLNEESVARGTVFAAEIGLTGEVRKVSHIMQRIKEAEKLGSKRIIVAEDSSLELNKSEIDVIQSARLRDVIDEVFN